MTKAQFLSLLKANPLVASVQASPGSACDDTETLRRMALASVSQGVNVLRLEGIERVRTIREATKCQVIGLVKRWEAGSEVYITPRAQDVRALAAAGCEAVAMDATTRPRPGGETLHHLVQACQEAGLLAVGDCDSRESYDYAVAAGCDMVTTALAGYTQNRSPTPGPDLELLGELVGRGLVPVLAEGRFETVGQVRAAMWGRATGVVVGGALNDPVKNSARFCAAAKMPTGLTAAFDVGGTWIRFGLFSDVGELSLSEAAPLPPSQRDRDDWMLDRIHGSGATRVGIAAGGTIHPVGLHVIETKASIPDNHGYAALAERCPVPVYALNDGLSTAWGHAIRLSNYGRSVLTLTFGTGVGAGFVAGGRLLMGPNGEYPRFNDWVGPDGRTIEERFGGGFLGDRWWDDPSRVREVDESLSTLVSQIQGLFRPDVTLLAGSVALACPGQKALASPYGPDAGLYGAAAIAQFPVSEGAW
ncbi:MAG: putative N-acetylmannosamine-6-phosphate 2-epimerase [Fimbriimonadaceae bacterium]|nr:putative N-acetylmannosamine-6-phosphate 2-epimerase [Fimbriimonadaceae bacterium]QYK58361.1 MAG: putative N-acetylmannosamine-6-phosphate 2-epimerase [Fimbriimonadaceae bacterium]